MLIYIIYYLVMLCNWLIWFLVYHVQTVHRSKPFRGLFLVSRTNLRLKNRTLLMFYEKLKMVSRSFRSFFLLIYNIASLQETFSEALPAQPWLRNKPFRPLLTTYEFIKLLFILSINFFNFTNDAFSQFNKVLWPFSMDSLFKNKRYL